MPLPWLDPDTPLFPAVRTALEDPNGLLAAGGDLSPEWLLLAYRNGIFPWYEAGQPILWWSPDPRLVLFPQHLKVSRSLRKFIKKTSYTLSMDRNFAGVIENCGRSRRSSSGTWITGDMQSAYHELHLLGHAHSVEVWADSALVGGLYGVAIGKVFFGESMFSAESNASKLALLALTRHLQSWGYELIDCQVSSEHLFSLGAEEIPREQFCQLLAQSTTAATAHEWQIVPELGIL